MEIKVKKLHKDAVLPKYTHSGDVRMDPYGTKEYLLKSGESVKIETEITIQLPTIVI